MPHESKLRKLLVHPKILFSIRVFLGFVFLLSSAGKILDPKAFAETLVAYHLIPSPLWVKYIAVTLPWIEWFCGAFLVLGVFTRSVSILSSGLFMVFIGGMSSALVRGLEIHCGCFGSGGEMIGPLSLLRDSFFLVLSLNVVFSEPDRYTLQRVLSRRSRTQAEQFVETT